MKRGYLTLIDKHEGSAIDADIREFTGEKKSYMPNIAFADFLGQDGQYDLQAYEAIRLYKKCKPLYHAINMRANAIAQLPFCVMNKKTGEIIPDHPALKLIANPNPSSDGSTFLRDISIYFDSCGVLYLYMTGNVAQPPLEVFPVSAQDVAVVAGTRYIGAQSAYIISCPQLSGSFQLSQTELGGSYRYYSDDERELAPVYDNIIGSINDSCRSHSPASTLWLQIQQFIEADKNNYSVLKRGARPSVAWAWKHDDPMTDEQYQRWVEQVKAYEGASNAGRQVLVDNLEPKVISQTNRDMEFAVNRKSVSNDIYSAYNVPLALVSSDQMTMDNLKVSTNIFYDMSVLPHADKLFAALSRIILPRYPDGENLCFGYDRAEIPALRERTWTEAKLMTDTGVLEKDEIRAAMGYEATGDNEQDDAEAEKHYRDYLVSKAIFSPDEIDIMVKARAARTH